jgi:hypothetical protein
MMASAPTPYEHRLLRFHQSLAGICLALMLVTGLVSMPTNCDCGAGIPHGHSLFILGGHYHGAAGAVFRAPADEMDHHHHHNAETPQAEPTFSGQVNHASSRVAADLPTFLLFAPTWERLVYPHDRVEFAGGRVVPPDHQPPRAG